MRAAGPAEKLVAFVLERGVARPGNAIVGGGVVTSGTFSPSLEVGIGMAYVPAAQRGDRHRARDRRARPRRAWRASRRGRS